MLGEAYGQPKGGGFCSRPSCRSGVYHPMPGIHTCVFGVRLGNRTDVARGVAREVYCEEVHVSGRATAPGGFSCGCSFISMATVVPLGPVAR